MSDRRIHFVGTVQEWARAEWATLRDMDEIGEPQVEWFATFLRADVIPSRRALMLARWRPFPGAQQHFVEEMLHEQRISVAPAFGLLPRVEPSMRLYVAEGIVEKFMLRDLDTLMRFDR